MRRRSVFAAASLLLSVAMANAGPGHASDGSQPSATPFHGAPAGSRARPNPYAGDPEAVRAGRKLYLRHCAACHGEDAQGTRRAPSLASADVRQAPPGEIEWLLRNGSMRRGMPSWSVLPEPRRWQIVTFLQATP